MANRRILFLDIDGVLNNRESMRAANGWNKVNGACCFRLRCLVEDLGLDLVLSSTWRKGGGFGGKDGFQQAQEAIHDASGWRARFLGFTPDGYREDLCGSEFASRRLRGEECNTWADRHGQTGDIYVAVDDDADFETFRGILVRTDHEPGLTDADCERIRQAFLSQEQK